jgi:hypothetical protein
MREWAESDRVCSQCLGDSGLQRIVMKNGTSGKCAACNSIAMTIAVQELAELVDEVYRRNIITYEHGSDPVELVSALIQDDDTGLPEAIVQILNEDEQDAVHDGDEEMYGIGIGYTWNEKTTFPYELIERWDRFEEGVKFSKRYENEIGREFLQEMLDAMQKLAGGQHIVELPLGSKIYKARSFERDEEVVEALNKLPDGLAPPPRRLRSAGRMNAPGIATFYGAFSAATCIAEVRPPVGGLVVTIIFETTRTLRLLDLTWFLEGGSAGSPFDDDHQENAEFIRFLRRFTRIVSSPVLPGANVIDYVPTQVAAEFFNVVGKFDGILYSSSLLTRSDAAERHADTNIALFDGAAIIEQQVVEAKRPAQVPRSKVRPPIDLPKAPPIESNGRPALKYISGSEMIVRIRDVEVSHESVWKLGDQLIGTMRFIDDDDE